MEFTIKTNKREEIIDVTKEIEKIIEKEGKNSKICLVYVPHVSCALIINENYDESICDDILAFLKKSIPQGIWKHDKTDNNADAHIKSSIIGPGQVIPIEKGVLQLGRWQSIALAEFDGPRERKIIVKII